MKEIAGYALERNQDLVIAVEWVNRFETHFLNIAETRRVIARMSEAET